MIQNKVILQERFFAESKRVADCIYSYGTQSRADMTLAVTLTGIFVTNWIMRDCLLLSHASHEEQHPLQDAARIRKCLKNVCQEINGNGGHTASGTSCQ